MKYFDSRDASGRRMFGSMGGQYSCVSCGYVKTKFNIKHFFGSLLEMPFLIKVLSVFHHINLPTCFSGCFPKVNLVFADKKYFFQVKHHVSKK